MQKIKWNKLYDYPKSVRSLINDERHYEVGNEKLPSVTTILSATEPAEKRASLAKWRARVGNEEAERIRINSTDRGTRMHSILEGYFLDKPILDATENGAEAQQRPDGQVNPAGDNHQRQRQCDQAQFHR